MPVPVRGRDGGGEPWGFLFAYGPVLCFLYVVTVRLTIVLYLYCLSARVKRQCCLAMRFLTPLADALIGRRLAAGGEFLVFFGLGACVKDDMSQIRLL